MMSKRKREWEDYREKISKKRTGKKKDEAGPSGLCGSITVQRLSPNVEGKCQKYSRIGALTLVPLEEEAALPNIKAACKAHVGTNLECDVLAGERGPSFTDASQIQNWKVIHIRFIEKSPSLPLQRQSELACVAVFSVPLSGRKREPRGSRANAWGESKKRNPPPATIFFVTSVPEPSRDSRLPERKRKRLLRRLERAGQGCMWLNGKRE